MKTLLLIGLLVVCGCSHPVRDERDALRAEIRAHCIEHEDYSPRLCHQKIHHLMIDDIALAYGTAR